MRVPERCVSVVASCDGGIRYTRGLAGVGGESTPGRDLGESESGRAGEGSEPNRDCGGAESGRGGGGSGFEPVCSLRLAFIVLPYSHQPVSEPESLQHQVDSIEVQHSHVTVRTTSVPVSRFTCAQHHALVHAQATDGHTAKIRRAATRVSSRAALRVFDSTGSTRYWLERRPFSSEVVLGRVRIRSSSVRTAASSCWSFPRLTVSYAFQTGTSTSVCQFSR